MKQVEIINAFCRHPRQVGAVVQSSRFLAKKMVEPIDFNNAKCIIELGAGTGIITKQILRKMTAKSILLCFEIDQKLANNLQKKFRDRRLKVINDSAENLEKYLNQFGYKKADYIISGLPLAWLPKRVTKNVLVVVCECLKNGGKYIQFQYSLNNRRNLKKIFTRLTVHFEFRNIPPAFVYICEK